MGGKSDEQTTFITEYYLSVHYGICAGPVDLLLAIKIADKEIQGAPITAGTMYVNRESIWGSILQEGSVNGYIDYMDGSDTQLASTALASRLGLAAADCPAFRGVASLFFHDGLSRGNADRGNSSAPGFHWQTNNPSIRPTSVAVQRLGIGVNSGSSLWADWVALRGIALDIDLTPWHGVEVVYDMNPSHIIYETMTNTDWGMGLPTWSLDFDSFFEAAQTLFDEEFGLSLIWAKQSTIEEFIQEILNHIQAVIFVQPSTGLITLKLLRNDYDPYAVLEANEANSKILSIKKRLFSETTNEIVVSWTNPMSEELETVRWFDPANIAIQGGVVSDSRNYYGVRKATLAQTLAIRDSRSAAAPLTAMEIEFNRQGWDLVVGDVIRVVSVEHQIEGMYCRIDNIDYGRPGDPKIKLSVTEDIFAFEQAHFAFTPPASDAPDLSEDPEVISFQLAQAMPYALAVLAARTTAVEFPDEGVSILAAQPGADTATFNLWGFVTNSLGETTTARLGSRTIVSHGYLGALLAAEAETVYSREDLLDLTQGGGLAVGALILIGDGDVDENELAVVTEVSDSPYTVTLKRGALDTVPKEWTVGSPPTPIWIIPLGTPVNDPIPRSVGEVLEYKLQAVTSRGTIDIDNIAGTLDYTVPQRLSLPTRPADVKVEGQGFGPIDFSATSPVTTDLDVTWANRNRLTEDTQFLAWDDASIPSEEGQTTKIYLLNATTRDVIFETPDSPSITGTSYSLSSADFGAESTAIVRVVSVRDGFESLQGHEIVVTIVPEPPTDPDFASVVLLLGFEGVDGSGIITDESSSAHGTATIRGTAQIDTAQKKFGVSSLVCDDGVSSISFPDDADYDLGAGDFTLEAFVRFNTTGFQFLFGQWQSVGDLGWIISADNAGLYFNVSTTLSDNTNILLGSTALTTGVWYHMCIDYDGAKYRAYVDGVMVASHSTPLTIADSPNVLSIGSNNDNDAFFFDGWMDELRITKGVARYASDGGFTPPTSAFPRS